MPNVFDTNDIRTTGLTVEGRTVLSGNSDYVILEVTGTSGTNLQVIDDFDSDLIWGVSGSTGALFEILTNRIDMFVDLTIDGDLAATTKSFDIPHPSKEGFRLRYGSLEGPEFGVYHRGKTNTSIIYLPHYWSDLIDPNTITVNLTPIGNNFHWVESVGDNCIYINSTTGDINTYFVVYAERKDIPPLTVEYKPL